MTNSRLHHLTRQLLTLTGVVCFFQIPVFGQVTIDLQLRLQPMQVANDNGTSPNTVTLSEAYWDKIFNQAGIDVVVLPTVVLPKTELQVMSTFEPYTVEGDPTTYLLHPNPSVINVLYVSSFADSGVIGTSAEPGRVASVKSSTAAQVGYDWLVAHEVGHAMGLSHDSSSNKNLMYPNSFGSVTIGNVVDGSGYFVLTSTQISNLRSSAYVSAIPEVDSFAVVVGLLAITFTIRRRLCQRSSSVIS